MLRERSARAESLTRQWAGEVVRPHATQWAQRLLLLALALLFTAAFALRLVHASAPPLDFHATRQYRSLLITRDFYYATGAAVPAWEREVARVSRERQGILEPPLMEALAAAGYRLAGGETMLVPRALASFFWLLGGVFLYLIARDVAGSGAAVASTALYLFLPFAVEASRSFQPDPLVIMLLLAGVWATLRYHERPDRGRFVLACVLAGLAAFLKPIVLMAAVAVFLALALQRQGLRRAATDPRTWVFGAAALLPALTFYLYGIATTDTLQLQAQSAFLPRLVVEPFFWRGWLGNIQATVGWPLFLLAVLGIGLFEPGRPRALVLGLWAGYAAFCLVFTYHIATHDYYHLQLVPIVALSLGPLGALVSERLLALNPRWYARVALAGVVGLGLLMLAVSGERRLQGGDPVDRVAISEAIGEAVGHSAKTVYLSADYGLPLEYHGRLSGRPWPLASDIEWERLAGWEVLSAEQRFETRFAGEQPDYFIIEDPQELAQQPDLAAFLARFPVAADGDSYTVYDLRRPSTESGS